MNGCVGWRSSGDGTVDTYGASNLGDLGTSVGCGIVGPRVTLTLGDTVVSTGLGIVSTVMLGTLGDSGVPVGDENGWYDTLCAALTNNGGDMALRRKISAKDLRATCCALLMGSNGITG